MAEQEHNIVALNDLPDGTPYPAELDGVPILLYRQGQTMHAISATCPHAGGRLHQGVQNGDRLVCPWHKATFCLRTGEMLEPPALDNLPRYQTRVTQGRVLVTTPAEQRPQPAVSSDQRTFIIIGAGAAGAVAAQTLRQSDFGGRVVIINGKTVFPTTGPSSASITCPARPAAKSARCRRNPSTASIG